MREERLLLKGGMLVMKHVLLRAGRLMSVGETARLN